MIKLYSKKHPPTHTKKFIAYVTILLNKLMNEQFTKLIIKYIKDNNNLNNF